MSIISNSVLGKCSKCGMDVSLNTLATHSCEALKLAQEQIEQLKKELDESLMKVANDRLDIEFPLVQEIQRLKEKNEKLVEALNKISIPDPVGYDGVLAWNFKEIARLALQENKK